MPVMQYHLFSFNCYFYIIDLFWSGTVAKNNIYNYFCVYKNIHISISYIYNMDICNWFECIVVEEAISNTQFKCYWTEIGVLLCLYLCFTTETKPDWKWDIIDIIWYKPILIFLHKGKGANMCIYQRANITTCCYYSLSTCMNKTE